MDSAADMDLAVEAIWREADLPAGALPWRREASAFGGGFHGGGWWGHGGKGRYRS